MALSFFIILVFIAIFAILIVIILLKNPLVILLFALLFDMIFGVTVNIFTVHPSNYLLFLVVVSILLRVVIFRSKIINNSDLLVFYKLLGICIIWVIFVYLLNDKSMGETIRIISKQYIASGLLAFSMIYLIKDIKKLQLFIIIFIIIGAMTSIVAIMQLMDIEFFWELRNLLGVDVTVSNTQRAILSRVRPCGLADNFIVLSYQLGSLAPILFGLILVKNGLINRKFLIKMFILISLGLISSLTRSAIIGLFFGLLTVILLNPLRRKKRLFLAALICTFSILPVYVIPQVASRFTAFNEGKYSGIGRIYTAYLATKAIIDHPFGTAELTAAYEMYHLQAVTSDFNKYFEYVSSPHNQFINITLLYGIPGLIILIIFYYRLFRMLKLNNDRISNNNFIHGLSIGLIGSFVSYIVNSFFHNGGPFSGDYFNWYFIGLAMVVIQLRSVSKLDDKHKIYKYSL